MLTAVFRHWPEQYEFAPGQRQIPPWQLEPPVQRTPHAPQLASLAERSAQVPLQAVVPPGQAQAPAMHSVPPAQTMPHPPQLDGSLVGSTQAVPHRTVPAAHRAAH